MIFYIKDIISKTNQLMMQYIIKDRLVPIGLFRIILVILMLFIFAHRSFSQTTRYWTGATDNNWSNTGNWSNAPGGGTCSCTPAASDPVIFNSIGNVNCVVNVVGGVTVGGITVNSGYTGTITLSNSLVTTGINIFSTGSLTGSSSLLLSSSTSTAFGGTSVDVTVSGTTASIVFNGSVFTKSVTITKTGASTDASSGGNTFGAAVVLTNSGSGNIQLENSSADIFNSDLTINNSGTGSIFIANSGTSAAGYTTFNGNISISNSPGASAKGIYFSNVTGASKQTTGTFALGGPFSGGELRIRSFSQSPANTNPVNLTLTGNAILYVGDNLGGTSGCNFMGNVTFKAPSITIDKSTYNGTAYLEKTTSTTAATSDIGIGQCTFNSTATFVNSSGASGGSLRTNGGNTFAAAVTVTNSSSKDITLEFAVGYTSTYNSTVSYNNSLGDINAAYNGTINFNGNISVTNTSSIAMTNGIFFGKNTGTATLAGSISTAGPFDSGMLQIQSVTQTSGASSVITLTSASSLSPSTLQVGPGNTFVSDVNFKAPQLLLSGGHYNGNNSSFEKTGGTSSDLGAGNNFFGDAPTDVITITNSGTTGVDLRTNGGNTFNGTTSINNTGTGDISMEYGNALGSAYNAPLTLTNNPMSGASVNITVGFNGTTTINGNITLSSTGNGGASHGIFFGDESSGGGGGSVILSSGYSMSLGAVGSFNAGQLRFVRFTQNGGTAQSLALTALSATVSAGFKIGPYSTFNGNVTFSAPSVVLDGCTYNGTADITKNTSLTTAVDDFGRGGNIFTRTTTITNSSNGILASASIAAASGGAADVFNSVSGTLTLTNSSSGAIRLADKIDNTVFNQNIICNSSGSGGIYIGYNTSSNIAGGTSSIAELKTITGTSSSGTVRFTNFTQGTSVSGTAQSLNFTGTTSLVLGPGTIFYGDVTFSSPRVFLNGATYYGKADITKSGVSPDAGTGGNTFKKTAKLSNTYTATSDATGIFQTANGSPDIFEDDLTTNNSGNGSISLAYNNPTVTQFKKNVIFNSTNSISASGVYIGVGGGVGATLAAGSKLLTGDDPLVSPAGSGVSGGKVFLGRLQQQSGVTTAQTLSFSHNTTNNPLLHISNSYFRGDVTFTADRILLDGNTFEGINSFTKTGTAGDDCGGGNTFTGGGSPYTKTTTLTTTSTTSGYWAFSNPGPADIFSGPLIINNNGTGGTANINMANNVTGATPTTFNNNVTFNCANASLYITVAISNSMSNPNPAGALFTAPGAVTAGGGVISMTSPPSVSAGTILLGKADVYGTQNITATTGQLIIGYGAAPYMPATYRQASHFRGDLTVQQNRVTVQYSTFDGSTSIEKTGGSTDTSSGSNTFGDTSTDAIQIKNSGAGTFTLGGDTFNGTTTGTNSSTGTLSFPGADIFNASATFTNSSTGTLSLSGTDAYNSVVSFNNTSTGTLSPANTGVSKFYSDITTNSPSSAITFGSGGGTVEFNASANQNIGKAASTLSPIFKILQMKQSSGGKVTLNADVTISGSLTFTAGGVGGVIYSTASNFLNFASGATHSGASSTSFVSGPVQKTGNQSFSFPVGKVGTPNLYRNIDITVSGGTTADAYTAEYFRSSATNSSSLQSPLQAVSGCEYWSLTRTTGTNNPTITMNWDSHCSSPYISDYTKLKIANYGSNWADIGSNAPSGGSTNVSGTISSSSALSSYGFFTLATTDVAANSLPIVLASFDVKAISNEKVKLEWSTASEINNMGFDIQKSTDGQEFYKIGFMNGHGTTAVAQEYSFEDAHLSVKNYYRLKQIDLDGKFNYSEVRFIQMNFEQIDLVVAPNPFTNLKPGKIIIEGCSPEIGVQLDIISSSGIHLKSYYGNLEDINTKFAIDIQSLEAGLYFVRALLEETHKVLIDKIIKN